MQQVTRYLAFLTLCLATLPASAPAQEEGGELLQLVAWDIDPADAGKWVQGIQKIVEAAKQANLPADYGWFFWQEDIFRYRLVYPVTNMAYFDDPQQWIRQFAETPGQATLTEAFQQLNEVAATTKSDMVTEHMAAWSRETDLAMSTLPHAHVDEVWVKGGMEEKFDAIMKEFIVLLDEIGYVYPVTSYRPRLGGTGEHYIVTFFDTRENFYGKNNLDRLVEQKGMSEKWGEMFSRFTGLITNAHHFDSDYQPGMSYSPEEEAASEDNGS